MRQEFVLYKLFFIIILGDFTQMQPRVLITIESLERDLRESITMEDQLKSCYQLLSLHQYSTVESHLNRACQPIISITPCKLVIELENLMSDLGLEFKRQDLEVEYQVQPLLSDLTSEQAYRVDGLNDLIEISSDHRRSLEIEITPELYDSLVIVEQLCRDYIDTLDPRSFDRAIALLYSVLYSFGQSGLKRFLPQLERMNRLDYNILPGLLDDLHESYDDCFIIALLQASIEQEAVQCQNILTKLMKEKTISLLS